MTGTIIPLRSKNEEASALARVDVVAAGLLTDGLAVSLSAARRDAILAELRTQRTALASVIADLRARSPSGDIHIDTVNADLSVAAAEGLAQIGLFIQHVETCAKRS